MSTEAELKQIWTNHNIKLTTIRWDAWKLWYGRWQHIGVKSGVNLVRNLGVVDPGEKNRYFQATNLRMTFFVVIYTNISIYPGKFAIYNYIYF